MDYNLNKDNQMNKILTNVFTKTSLIIDGKICWQVTRNYKNGTIKPIGRIFKTEEGCIRQMMHRNKCYLDRYHRMTILVNDLSDKK